jgi:hypothetical protein
MSFRIPRLQASESSVLDAFRGFEKKETVAAKPFKSEQPTNPFLITLEDIEKLYLLTVANAKLFRKNPKRSIIGMLSAGTNF